MAAQLAEPHAGPVTVACDSRPLRMGRRDAHDPDRKGLRGWPLGGLAAQPPSSPRPDMLGFWS